ncbi:hypothetical protein [uncultured Roseivirga sp.]|uniref:hypothetical protein n=1 Tax=uncultured Roseivirga sp. TaxID=543088 RepID=UPI0030DD33CD|tara:strand:+ start:91723 stop:91989 length:267 start_codon:yes stop_codon:yes gene_type:complete
MAVYCISYDLKSKNYESLIEAIQSYGLWWHQSESTWFIETKHTSRQVIDNLRNFTSANDKLIVIRVQGNWSAIGHKEEEYNWLRARNF